MSEHRLDDRLWLALATGALRRTLGCPERVRPATPDRTGPGSTAARPSSAALLREARSDRRPAIALDLTQQRRDLGRYIDRCAQGGHACNESCPKAAEDSFTAIWTLKLLTK
jgi:hypothetical protein